MEKPGTTLFKVILFVTGAFLGALLARWCDQLLISRAKRQSEYDKTRYAQGLGPLSPPSSYER